MGVKVGDKVKLSPNAVVGEYSRREIADKVGTIVRADDDGFDWDAWSVRDAFCPGQPFPIFDWVVDFGLSRPFGMFEDNLVLER